MGLLCYALIHQAVLSKMLNTAFLCFRQTRDPAGQLRSAGAPPVGNMKIKGKTKMKKYSQTIKGYCAGLLTAVLISGMAFSADAASLLKEIKVSIGGIQIYVDGNLKKPVDGNGNEVEPLIYNGTTYLPVRALTNMLTDKEVSWDGNAQAVYIGKKPDNGGKSVTMDTLKPFSQSSGGIYMRTGKDAQYEVLGDVHSPFNRLEGSPNDWGKKVSTTYKLDSDYSKLHGFYVIPYSKLGANWEIQMNIYSVDQNGEKNLLDSYNAKTGDSPIEVETNISGCNFVTIEFICISRDVTMYMAAFYDVTLTTAN